MFEALGVSEKLGAEIDWQEKRNLSPINLSSTAVGDWP